MIKDLHELLVGDNFLEAKYKEAIDFIKEELKN